MRLRCLGVSSRRQQSGRETGGLFFFPFCAKGQSWVFLLLERLRFGLARVSDGHWLGGCGGVGVERESERCRLGLAELDACRLVSGAVRLACLPVLGRLVWIKNSRVKYATLRFRLVYE